MPVLNSDKKMKKYTQTDIWLNKFLSSDNKLYF